MTRLLWHAPPLVGPPSPQPHNRPKTMTTTTTTMTSVGDRQRVSSRTRSAFKAHTFALLPTKNWTKGYQTFCSRSSSPSSSAAAAEKVCWFLKFSLRQRASHMRKCTWLCIPPRLLLLLLLLELHHFRYERASKTLLSTQMHTQEAKWTPSLFVNLWKIMISQPFIASQRCSSLLIFLTSKF